jgi:hypothetical protein
VKTVFHGAVIPTLNTPNIMSIKLKALYIVIASIVFYIATGIRILSQSQNSQNSLNVLPENFIVCQP